MCNSLMNTITELAVFEVNSIRYTVYVGIVDCTCVRTPVHACVIIILMNTITELDIRQHSV